MLAHSKAALIALALVLSCSPVFAQGDPPGRVGRPTTPARRAEWVPAVTCAGVVPGMTEAIGDEAMAAEAGAVMDTTALAAVATGWECAAEEWAGGNSVSGGS